MGNDKIPNLNWGAYLAQVRDMTESGRFTTEYMLEAYYKANDQALFHSQRNVALAFLEAMIVPTGPERDARVERAQQLNSIHADKFGERMTVAFQRIGETRYIV